jgi:hypothetical protein
LQRAGPANSRVASVVAGLRKAVQTFGKFHRARVRQSRLLYSLAEQNTQTLCILELIYVFV